MLMQAKDAQPEETGSPYGEEMEMFRETVRAYFKREVEPNLKKYEEHGSDRDIWRKAGEYGLLGTTLPEEYGGAGADRMTIMILSEELGYQPSGATMGSFLGTDICTNFLVDFGTEEQKHHWGPGIVAGELIQCMGLTEPESGSDATSIRTTAVRDGDHYVINGSKCFISNGAKANLIYTICKTDPAAKGRGMSVIAVEAPTEGFSQRRMITQGYKAGDTGELFYNNVRVPVSNLIGVENQAMSMFIPTIGLDRMQIVARSVCAAQTAFELTLEHCKQRKIFGQRLIDFQNTQFMLATMETEIDVGRAYLDKLVGKMYAGTLTDQDAAKAKIWLCELEFRTLDNCVQLWGGNGWMDEQAISRMFTAARVQRIFAGATELMKSQLAKRYLK